MRAEKIKMVKLNSEVSEDLKERIKEYQRNNGFPSMGYAVIKLIEYALDRLS